MTANTINNRISLDIPDEDMQVIRSSVQALQEKLLPHLVDLNVGDRRKLPKMGAKTVDFVSKTLSYTRANTQMVPGFVDADEFNRDLAAVGILRELQQPLKQLADMVDDSLLLSGSEAYAAALACYHGFRLAAKMNMPGAETIYVDLSERFPGRPTKAAAAAARAVIQQAQTDSAA